LLVIDVSDEETHIQLITPIQDEILLIDRAYSVDKKSKKIPAIVAACFISGISHFICLNLLIYININLNGKKIIIFKINNENSSKLFN